MNEVKFSGYKVAVCAGLICMATLGFGYLTLSLYLPILCTELNAPSSVISGMFAVLGAVSMMGSFLSGKIIEKIGLKKLITLGCLSLLVGYGIMYVASNVALVYLSAGFIGLSLSWAGVICVGGIIPNWFIRKQGSMLGIVMAASGVGGFIGSPVVSSIMAAQGWRTACLVTVIAMAVFVIPAMLLIVGKPEDIGQKPLGFEDNANQSAVAVGGPDFATARASAAFFLVAITILAFGMLVSGLNPHVPSLITSKGFDIVFSGTILAIVSVFNTVGNLLFGLINDKLGIRGVMIWLTLCSAVGLFAIFGSSQTLIYVFAVAFGLAMPASGVIVPMLTASIFGLKSFPQMLGITNGLVGLVGIFSAVVIGILNDVSGSYALALIVLLVLVAIGFIAFLAAYGSSRKLFQENGKENVS